MTPMSVAGAMAGCPAKTRADGRMIVATDKTMERTTIMFYKHQFTIEIDHETAQRFRDRCAQAHVGIAHALRCLLRPDSADGLYRGAHYDFSGIPRLPHEDLANGGRPDSLSVGLTPAMYDVFTRYALGENTSRSELARKLIKASLTDPNFDLKVAEKTRTLELDCRESLAGIGAASHEENCARCGRKSR